MQRITQVIYTCFKGAVDVIYPNVFILDTVYLFNDIYFCPIKCNVRI